MAATTAYRWLLAACAACLVCGPAAAACPPAGWDVAALQRLRDARFELPDATRREALARGLLPCLSDPSPLLRDEIAFEALSTWMRKGQISVPRLQELRSALLDQLEAEDPDGYARPFAALALSEVARVDRLTPYLSGEERADLLVAGAAYLRSVRDYRGFDPRQGWRHGVAHGADLLLQLSLNPALTREQLDVIVLAIGTQVAPPGEHFFIYGEPARLARPIFSIAERGLHDKAYWSGWFAGLASPAPARDWPAALASQAGLARRHNTDAFVRALYAGVNETGNAFSKERLLPALSTAIRTLP